MSIKIILCYNDLMNILGIIAEFNPLHTGHEYLIRHLRRETGADYCVVVMSGDYVQRGEPAFFSKALRTKAALLSGADLVLELPLSVATGSAEYFAEGAVSLLDRLGCVTHLGFGSESGDITAFQLAGKLLSEEPEGCQRLLQENLKKGTSFPKARYEALAAFLAARETDQDFSAVLSLLRSPNNILGTEYCKALYKQSSSIIPVTLRRMGAGYHEDLPDTPAHASATGLRNAFRHISDLRDRETLLRNYVPESCHSLYRNALRQKQHVVFDDFYLPLYYTLQYTNVENLLQYQDVTTEFAEKLKKLFLPCSSVSELCDILKSKNLTSARIRRSLLHILLHMTKETVAAEKEQGLSLYARILGFHKEAEPLLSEIARHTSIPLVSKLADAPKTLSPLAFAQLKQTIKASELYRAVMSGAEAESEYSQPITIL